VPGDAGDPLLDDCWSCAEKQLAALDKPIRERVAAAIDALAETPRPSGAIAMQGAAGLLRIRVGSYRVVYTVSDRELIVLVIDTRTTPTTPGPSRSRRCAPQARGRSQLMITRRC
jgi:mRNA interferase RelE/StbE